MHTSINRTISQLSNDTVCSQRQLRFKNCLLHLLVRIFKRMKLLSNTCCSSHMNKMPSGLSDWSVWLAMIHLSKQRFLVSSSASQATRYFDICTNGCAVFATLPVIFHSTSASTVIFPKGSGIPSTRHGNGMNCSIAFLA